MASATCNTDSVLDAIELGWSMAEPWARYWLKQTNQPVPRRLVSRADSDPPNLPLLDKERLPARGVSRSHSHRQSPAGLRRRDLTSNEGGGKDGNQPDSSTAGRIGAPESQTAAR
jgi:hypothetical protein